MRPYKVIISGGGTGGHIYPAIAIAREFERRYPDAQLLFVGAQDRMEMEKVPQAGYKIEGLWISGIQRTLTLDNLAFPFKLLSSLWKSKKIIKRFKPDAVVGTGGFASGPLLRMATAKNIPALIQEQNGYAGITNKWLGKTANVICVAYDNMHNYFPEDKIIKTGNPVRNDLLEIKSKRTEGQEKYKVNPTKQTILVLGGSLGARAINQLIAEKLDVLTSQNVQLIWQTGKLYYEQYKHLQSDTAQVMAYIDRMDLAYAAADIIISRAGASSVSELCIVGKPTVFIPSPNVAEDHQTKNAEAIAKAGGAIVIKESNAAQIFDSTLKDLLSDTSKQASLSKAIKALALPEATSDIVDQLEKLIKA